ncbi:MAG: (2Fe-2S)-binding protein [Betaproteobacteria bacterium]|nr:(2Fe-2S)-binding protein [Betaproteobacteria bacterium]
MFRRLPETAAQPVTVVIDGRPVRVPFDLTAAAAVLIGDGITRTTPVSGSPRAPYCMMGVCFDCLMEIDGVPNTQACMVPVAEGMRINRQVGARKVRS